MKESGDEGVRTAFRVKSTTMQAVLLAQRVQMAEEQLKSSTAENAHQKADAARTISETEGRHLLGMVQVRPEARPNSSTRVR